MKFILYGLLLLFTLIGVSNASFLVRNGEVNLHADVARDFFLLDELDHKKIVFIGPRSSNSGIFHGPLWTYVNYPAYVLGNGNPVTVAWFWIFLEIIFLVTSFLIAKRLFGALPAFSYVAILSLKLVPFMNRVFHSEAAFFITPLYFFTIVLYVQSRKKLYLALHFLAAAVLTQLNIGVGIQMLALSLLFTFLFIVKNKLYKHLLIFALIPLFLANFIIFDFRHEFIMTKTLLATGGKGSFLVPFPYWLQNRIDNFMPLGLIDAPNVSNSLILIIFLLIVSVSILQLKKKGEQKHIYLLFLYFYFGYAILSFFNKGIVLYHQIHFLIPLTTLWLVSFLNGKYKLLFLPLVVIMLFLSYSNSDSYINSKKSQIGDHSNSWKALSAVADYVVKSEEGKEFGYYVFSPDALAYQPRYAMYYHFRTTNTAAFEYKKYSTTYVIAAPPPPNDIYMDHVWWRKNSVKISSDPKIVKKFPGGFTVEKFELSPEEQQIPHSKTIEVGLHFR